MAGLPCLALAQPRAAFAQAEELPPEPAPEQVQPAPSPSPSPAPGTQPPPSQVPATPAHEPTVLFLPYLGFSSAAGDDWAGYDASPRLGLLFGWQASARLSLNIEGDIDYVRGQITTEGQSSGTSFWGGFWNPPRHYLDVALSPLVSLRAGQIRLGPKLGWFASRGVDKLPSWASGVPATGSGVVVGFNAGLFVPYRGLSVGGLLTGSFRYFTSASQAFGAHHTLGLLLALLL